MRYCPSCLVGTTKVIHCKAHKTPEPCIHRRRACTKCSYRFTTVEVNSLFVAKSKQDQQLIEKFYGLIDLVIRRNTTGAL